MNTNDTSKYFNRRTYLRSIGAAGLGTLGLFDDSASAETSSIDPSLFDYEYRTYRSDEIIRIGMIGTDGHPGMVLDDLHLVENTKLVAYSQYDNPNLKIPDNVRIYNDYEDMLEKEEIDIAVINMPYYLNASASIAAAERKIHVITEKPVATTIDDLNRLLKSVTSNKIRLTALFGMRMEPRFQTIRNAVSEGKIGEPIMATAQKSYKFGESRPEFYKKVETYGGTIPWVGIHAIDYIHFTTGLLYNRVAAIQGNKVHPAYPGLQDYAGVMLEMNNGGTAMINIDYLRPETAPTHGDDRLRIAGSEGVIEIKGSGESVELISSAGQREMKLPEAQSLFADFMTELRSGKKHIISPEEPFEMTRVALLAHQAALKNSIILL